MNALMKSCATCHYWRPDPRAAWMGTCNIRTAPLPAWFEAWLGKNLPPLSENRTPPAFGQRCKTFVRKGGE